MSYPLSPYTLNTNILGFNNASAMTSKKYTMKKIKQTTPNFNFLRNHILHITFLVLTLFIGLDIYAQTNTYKDSTLSVDARVEDLLKRMTIEEKFWQLFMIPGDLREGSSQFHNGIFGFQVSSGTKTSDIAGQEISNDPGLEAQNAAIEMNEIQRYFVEETRLGIPVIFFDEALHGLVRRGGTAFPQAIGLAATWDTTLMRNISKTIAIEAGSRGIRQILSPVLNIARDVRWGRTEETYGEDPYLTSMMALSYISELERAGIIATPKHFAVNVGDGGRDSYPIHYNQRLLEEVYFPAFKTAIIHGGARSIMTSYNSLDGSPCSANDWLLNTTLKNEWGFDGFVISDAGATGGANVLHFTAEDYAVSTQNALNAGLDVIFQTSYTHFPLFYAAVEKGLLDTLVIDNAVRRVLKAKFELGLFDHPYVNPEYAESNNNTAGHRMLSRQAARESIVLLKNENAILPLNTEIGSIAIIGIDASVVNLGGYSGPGNNNVSILDGIKQCVSSNSNVYYAPGCGHSSPEFVTIPNSYLYAMNDGAKINGLNASYFDNISLSGEARIERIDPDINFSWTLFSPEPSIPYDWYSVRWNGIIKAPLDGTYKIGIEGNDGYRLYINNELIIDRWEKQTYRSTLVDYKFEKDKEYDIRVEYFESTGNARIRLVWSIGADNTWTNRIQESVNIAKKSDVAIIVTGIEEGEFRDRSSLKLPGHQEEMIKAISATGTPVIVVLTGGSAITMENWINDVDAILNVWYPGEDGGNAVADVLFGKYNPAGRLPITYPKTEGQLPLYYNHKPTGRGDDYNDLSGQPLFPFGFGLSYSRFEYSNLRVRNAEFSHADSCKIVFTIKNLGPYDGDEVIQLYIRDEIASVARPLMELKAFKRVHLKNGESMDIEFQITSSMLQMFDKDMNLTIEPGAFRVMIGASSKDIRLRTIIHYKI